MNPEKIIAVEKELARVTAAIKAVREVAGKDAFTTEKRHHYFYGSKETGALRRASMDLTRALADLRRPL
jgi:hypothetical protein